MRRYGQYTVGVGRHAEQALGRHNPVAAARTALVSDPKQFTTVYNFLLHKTKPPEGGYVVVFCRIFGSGGRDRTYDQLINSQLLYR
jgi:hypothetical protein